MEDSNILRCPDCNEPVAGPSVYLMETEDNIKISLCIYCSAILRVTEDGTGIIKMSKEQVHALSDDIKGRLSKAFLFMDNLLIEAGAQTPRRPVTSLHGSIDDPTGFYVVEIEDKLLVYSLPEDRKVVPVFSCLDAVHELVNKLVEDGKKDISVAKIVDGLDFLNMAEVRGFELRADLLPLGEILSTKIVQPGLLN